MGDGYQDGKMGMLTLIAVTPVPDDFELTYGTACPSPAPTEICYGPNLASQSGPPWRIVMSRRLRLPLAIAAAMLPTAAFAHVGAGDTHGFSHGFAHPIGGMDHVLAMVAVGLYATHLGGRALWLVPAAFVGMMSVGGVLGISGVDVPFVEIGIGLSVVVLGLAVAFQVNLPTLAAMALVGLFAIFHGHAHGAEIPDDAGGGVGYAAGFMLATAMLHGAGIALGLTIARLGQSGGKRIVQATGGAMALAGVGILSGWL